MQVSRKGVAHNDRAGVFHVGLLSTMWVVDKPRTWMITAGVYWSVSRSETHTRVSFSIWCIRHEVDEESERQSLAQSEPRAHRPPSTCGSVLQDGEEDVTSDKLGPESTNPGDCAGRDGREERKRVNPIELSPSVERP